MPIGIVLVLFSALGCTIGWIQFMISVQNRGQLPINPEVTQLVKSWLYDSLWHPLDLLISIGKHGSTHNIAA